MSDAQNVEAATNAAASNTTAPVDTAPVSNSAAGATSSYNANSKISNMNELKEKAPEVYKAMMQGIAQSIIGRMRDQQEHLKKMMREGQRDS